MARQGWEDEDDEDNFKVLGSVNDTPSTVATVVNTTTAAMSLDFLQDQENGNITLMSSSNESLYPVVDDESIVSYYLDNSTMLTGESDCLDCNSSFLNLSTNAGQMEHHDHDELYEVPLSMIICLSLLYGAISVSALVGNTLVLWVVAVSRRMRTVTNMFIANLAMADIIIGLFTIPFQFQAALLQRWNLPDFMCAFCPFIQVLSVNVSVFTLSAIAVDRYRAVLYPLSARVSKRKAAWAILSIWAVGFILALPTELDYKVTQIEHKGGTKPFCANLGLPVTFRIIYHQGIVVIQYFFPLIIITVAYVHMGLKLWGATAPGNKEESRDAVVLRNKKKVIKMLAIVVLMFGLCWLPLQTYNFLQHFFPQINSFKYINVMWFGFHLLAMANSSVNPALYAIYNDKFQREFQTRLRCFRRCYRAGDDGNYSEGSDIDRSKIRASYKFTNNRCGGSSINARSGYNNPTSRSNIQESTRSCSIYRKGNNGTMHSNSRCTFEDYNECQNGKRYLGVVGAYTFESSHPDLQTLNKLNNHYHHHNHRSRHHHRRHRTSRGSAGASGSSEGSSSGNNNSSGSYTNELELDCTGVRFNNGDLRAVEGTNNSYYGMNNYHETEAYHQQETSLTEMNNTNTAAMTTAVAVVTANGKAITKGSNNPIKMGTSVANNACPL